MAGPAYTPHGMARQGVGCAGERPLARSRPRTQRPTPYSWCKAAVPGCDAAPECFAALPQLSSEELDEYYATGHVGERMALPAPEPTGVAALVPASAGAPAASAAAAAESRRARLVAAASALSSVSRSLTAC